MCKHEQKCPRPALSRHIFLAGGKFGVLLGRVPHREKLCVAELPLRDPEELACLKYQIGRGIAACATKRGSAPTFGHPACTASWARLCLLVETANRSAPECAAGHTNVMGSMASAGAPTAGWAASVASTSVQYTFSPPASTCPTQRTDAMLTTL